MMNAWAWWAPLYWQASKRLVIDQKKLFLAWIFLIGSIFWAPVYGAVSAEPVPIDFEADALEYAESGQVIIASGNVRVLQSSYTFHSDYALFNIPSRSLQASGFVRFTDNLKNEIRSRSLSYDAQEKSAELVDAEGSFGPFVFAAKKVARDSLGNIVLEKSQLTTCGANLSTYHLYGYRINILPNKRMTVLHSLFWLGPVPVFYLPYYYHPLGEKHLAFQSFPGQNQSEGVFARTVWGYPVGEETYARAYIDYLAKRGIGTGGEVSYYWGTRGKGSLYVYRISDRVLDRERWNARLYHWQELAPSLVAQSNINQLSDDAFPNDFFREDFNRVVRNFNSSAALTYQKKSHHLRVYGERLDHFDSVSNNFFVERMFAPKIDYTQYQTPVGFFGVDKSFNFSAANKFAGTGYTGETLTRRSRAEFDAAMSLLRRINIYSSSALVPKVTLRNQWIQRPEGSEFQEYNIQRVDAEALLRQPWGQSLDVDLTYLITHRLQANSGRDQGRENHRISFLSYYRPTPLLSLRFNTAHNLPVAQGESVKFLDRKQYDPLQGEFSLDLENNVEFFYRQEYLLSDAITGSPHPLSSQSELSFGRRSFGEDYYSIGTSYSLASEDSFELRQSGRWAPSRLWTFEGTLRTQIFYNNASMFSPRKADFIEKEIKTRTSWRCWDLQFTFRERTGVLEFQFNLELKLDQEDPNKKNRVQRESEFYPWRGLQAL